jgi:hypothetical protein
MITNSEKPRWSFYLGWVALNIIAVVAAWFIAWALISLITQIVGDTIEVAGQSRIIEDSLYMVLLFPIIGLLIGIFQYILLRRYLPRLTGWIPATFLGWLMPFVTGFFIVTVLGMKNDTLSIMLGLLLIGASVALPQWWLLRQRVRYAFWWILACGLGWSLAGLLNNVTSNPLPVLIAIALLPAIATGIACWLLLDWYPRQQLQSSVPAVP